MNGQAGYTILEALCAFAILSFVLVALYEAGGIALRSLDSATAMDRVSLLAQSKLDELASVRDPLPKNAEGSFPGERVRWRYETEEIAPATAGSGSPSHLQSVRLVLSWQQGLATRSLAIETRHFGMERPQ